MTDTAEPQTQPSQQNAQAQQPQQSNQKSSQQSKHMMTPREKKWIVYDVGNSAFVLLSTAVVPIYADSLLEAAGQDNIVSTWGYAQTVASLVIALLMPILGSIADVQGMKIKFFLGFFLTGVVMCLGMSLPLGWLAFLIVYVLATIGLNGSMTFYDSMLIDTTSNERMDKVSSHGYAWGYVGSTIPFIVCIAVIFGGPSLLGLDTATCTRISFLITAVWWVAFTVPLLRSYRQVHYRTTADHTAEAVRGTFRELAATFRRIAHDRSLLLVMIAVLFVACLVIPHDAFPAPSGDYAQLQLSRGFLDGYQTMDLLAALYFGIVISANVRQMGITSVSQSRRETGYAGLGTGILLVAIYGALAFIGMVSGSITPVDPATDPGATVLTNHSYSAIGPVGTAFLGVIFIIACFNVCTGLISTCGTFFHSHFPTVAGRPVSYRVWSAIFAAFSFLVSNAGLNTIIKVSVPVLSALYPIAIVLVALSLVHGIFSSRFPRVYFWAVLLAGIVSIVNCCAELIALLGVSFGWLDALVGAIPFNDLQIGWLIPALIGTLIGVADSLARDRRRA